MLPPSTRPLRLLSVFGVALLYGAGVRLLASTVGPRPVILAWAGLATLGACAAVRGLQWQDRRPRPLRIRALRAGAPVLAIAMLPIGASHVGPLRAQASTPLLLLTVGWCAAQIPVWRTFLPALRGGGPALPLAASLGVAAGIVLPPVAAALLAGALSLPLVPRKSLQPTGVEPGTGDTALLVAAALGTASAWGAARAVVAPALDGLGALAVGLLLGLGVGRQAAPAGRPLRVAASAVALLALHLLWTEAPGLARDLALARLPSVLDGTATLLLAPLGMGVAGGVVCGLAAGPVSRSAHLWGWLVALGLVVSLPVLPVPAVLATALGGIVVIASGTPSTRLAAVVALVTGGAGWVLLPDGPTSGAVGAWRVLRGGEEVERDNAARAAQQTVFSQTALHGAATLRADDAAFASPPPPSVSWTAELDGLTAFPSGRAAAAEGLAGVLAGSLRGGAPDRVLVLGDDAARVLPFLVAAQPGLVTVASPQPALVQNLAAVDATARANFLHPAVRLRPGHPDAVLRTVREQDVIVEVARAPWADSAHAALDAAHLGALRRALAPGGTFVLVVHLGWWPDGSVAALAGQLASEFIHLQVWLPPAGADSLVFVASDRQPRLAELLEGAAPYRQLLSDLGLPGVESAASLAVSDTQGARAWAEGATAAPTRRLNRSVLTRPVLHVDRLAAHLAPPTRTWETEGVEIDLDLLAARTEARRTFLSLLTKAATGDMGSVFAGAKALVDEDEELATQALSVLIEPHLRQARQALVRARVEGSNSTGWEEAQRFASTARMLSPRSLEPPLLLAEIALAQKNLNSSDELFKLALALDPNSLEALGGLARTAQARRDGEAAVDWLRQATTVDGQDWRTWLNLGVQLWRMAKTEEAEEVLRRASALAGPEEAAPHTALAELYLSVDRPTTALVHAERAAVLGGGSPASFYRGRAHEALGRLDDAEENYRQSTLQDANAILPRLGVARVRGLRGDLAGAAEALRAVLALDPSHAMARSALGRIEDALRAQATAAGAGLP